MEFASPPLCGISALQLLRPGRRVKQARGCTVADCLLLFQIIPGKPSDPRAVSQTEGEHSRQQLPRLLTWLLTSRLRLTRFCRVFQKMDTTGVKVLETAEDIQDRRQQVLDRYRRFKELSVMRRQKLEDSYRFQCFRRDAEELEKWIQEKLQIASDENYKDPSNLQVGGC